MSKIALIIVAILILISLNDISKKLDALIKVSTPEAIKVVPEKYLIEK